MHSARFLLPALLALAAAGCAQQQQQAYLIDPATGRATPVVLQQQPPAPQYAQQGYQPPAASERGLFNSWQSAPQPQYAQLPPPGGRGLFSAASSAPLVYAQAAQPQSYPPPYGAPRSATPATGKLYLPPPNNALAAASLY